MSEATRLKLPVIRKSFRDELRSDRCLWEHPQEMEGNPLKDIPWLFLKDVDEHWHARHIGLSELFCRIPHGRYEIILDGVELELILMGILDGWSPVTRIIL
jgi:hypothetical protein